MTVNTPSQAASELASPRTDILVESAASEDGDLTDMLSELRVLLPTAQLLSAFLVTVPFSAGFGSIASQEKWVFVWTFVLSIASLVLLSAPAVQHRLLRPLGDRPRFKRFASRQIVAGSMTLASAVVLASQLVLSSAFGHWIGNSIAAMLALLILALWWALPRFWRSAGHL